MAAAAGSLRERALQLLGLARRGARLRAGADDAERAIGSGSARLLVVAADASDRTAREFSQAARLRGIPVVEAFTRQALGLATGRPDTAVMAVEDAEMASDLQFWLGAATRLESGGRPEPPRQDPRPAVETKDGGA
jgi:ribosomal protein L7Ae-like RNA K-turn-binding protein